MAWRCVLCHLTMFIRTLGFLHQSFFSAYHDWTSAFFIFTTICLGLAFNLNDAEAMGCSRSSIRRTCVCLPPCTDNCTPRCPVGSPLPVQMSSICESSKESNSAGQSTITVTFFPSYLRNVQEWGLGEWRRYILLSSSGHTTTSKNAIVVLNKWFKNEARVSRLFAYHMYLEITIFFAGSVAFGASSVVNFFGFPPLHRGSPPFPY